jgi:DNA end-binding protein Ku
MARAIWSGIITFGLVSIPVKLYSATENRDISFHQLHDKCKTRIKEQRWCPTCERTIDWEEVQKGFEYAKGEYVIVTPEDLEKLPLPSKQTIAVQAFVKLSDIDPVYFEKSYYLEPDEKASHPYALFLKVLSQKGMVGIASVALRNKERLCCLRPYSDTLLMNTLLYPDEIRVKPETKMIKTNIAAKEVTMAAALVDMMVQPFEPELFKDHYREALQELIDAKLKGHQVAHPTSGPTKVYDLMDALKASLEGAKSKSRKVASSSTQKKRRRAS